MSKPNSKQSNSRSLLWAIALLAITIALYLMTRDANQRGDDPNDGENQNSISDIGDPPELSYLSVQQPIGQAAALASSQNRL